MQIKITARYHFIPTGITKIEKTITSVGEDVEKLELAYTAVENIKWCSHLGTSSKIQIQNYDMIQ